MIKKQKQFLHLKHDCHQIIHKQQKLLMKPKNDQYKKIFNIIKWQLKLNHTKNGAQAQINEVAAFK